MRQNELFVLRGGRVESGTHKGTSTEAPARVSAAHFASVIFAVFGARGHSERLFLCSKLEYD